jgi:hypothetical protein
LAANDIIITPDATNANSPGFILSERCGRGVPKFFLIGGATEAVQLDELNYTVSLTDPNSGDLIIGTTVTVPHAGATATDPQTNTIKAQAASFLVAGPCSDDAIAGVSVENSVLPATSTSTTDDTLRAQGCQSVTQAQGAAQIFLVAQNGVPSLLNAGYYVDESAPSIVSTPQPSTLFSLALGLLAMIAIQRRRLVASSLLRGSSAPDRLAFRS